MLFFIAITTRRCLRKTRKSPNGDHRPLAPNIGTHAITSMKAKLEFFIFLPRKTTPTFIQNRFHTKITPAVVGGWVSTNQLRSKRGSAAPG